MNKVPNISVVIVNYNSANFLRQCIDSLLNCTLSLEIIVVDNDSHDGSVDTLSGYPEVQLIRNTDNLGFANACNTGVRSSTAPFILFLNPDCYFEPDTLVILLDALRSNVQAGMAGGLICNADGSEQAGGRRAIPTPWRSFVRAFGLSRLEARWPKLFYDFNLLGQPLPEHDTEVEAISGACMLVKREAIDVVGLLDDIYFLHCEDLDWCMRFRQQNWKILFVPSAKIYHALGVCSSSRPIFVEWHKHKGMLHFYHKFFRYQYPGILMWLVAIGVWLHFVLAVTSKLSLRFKTYVVSAFDGSSSAIR